MTTLARWCFRHRTLVLLIWGTVLVGTVALARVAGTDYRSDFSLPGTESQRATDLLRRDFPARAGDTDTVVLHARSGSVRDPAVRDRARAMLGEVAGLPHVRGVVGPYEPAGAAQVSRDGRTAFAQVIFDAQAPDLPTDAIERVVDTARAAENPQLQVEEVFRKPLCSLT